MAEAVTRTSRGIPYLKPDSLCSERQKPCRPKDEADLTLVLPTLDQPALRRLRAGLEIADASHEWLARIS